jgi:hypothetical protein
MEFESTDDNNISDEIDLLLTEKSCKICNENFEISKEKHQCLLQYFTLLHKKFSNIQEKNKIQYQDLESKVFSFQTRIIDLEERQKYLQSELENEKHMNSLLTDKIGKLLTTSGDHFMDSLDPYIEKENKDCVELINSKLAEFKKFINRGNIS